MLKMWMKDNHMLNLVFRLTSVEHCWLSSMYFYYNALSVLSPIHKRSIAKWDSDSCMLRPLCSLISQVIHQSLMDSRFDWAPTRVFDIDDSFCHWHSTTESRSWGKPVDDLAVFPKLRGLFLLLAFLPPLCYPLWSRQLHASSILCVFYCVWQQSNTVLSLPC